MTRGISVEQVNVEPEQTTRQHQQDTNKTWMDSQSNSHHSLRRHFLTDLTLTRQAGVDWMLQNTRDNNHYHNLTLNTAG